MAPELKLYHVVIFPFMAQGHTIPLIDLAKELAKRGLKVTIITTPSNASPIAQAISKYPLITLTEIPFPNNKNLPKGIENTSQLPSMAYLVPFLQSTMQLKEPFDTVLKKMSSSNDLPICVISDFFLGWTFRSCQVYGVPRLVFHGMSVLSMAISKSAWAHAEKFGTIESSHPLMFEGLNLPFALTGADLPLGTGSQYHDDPFSRVLAEVMEGELNSWGIIVNSFPEIEGDYISSLEQFFEEGTKAYLLGPLSLYGNNDDVLSSLTNFQYQNKIVMKWLDKFQTQSISAIYVSFGTQADVSDAQLDEVAYGLEASGVPSVWVVRSETWNIPIEIEEKMKGKVHIVRKWVDQRSILAHPAIGGFISHCGWNSVLESISCAVPLLAWPLIAEQTLNAKFVTEVLSVGIRVNKYIEDGIKKCDGLIRRGAVYEGVKELMKGGKGEVAREKAKVLERIARMAVGKGGSSHNTLDDLIRELCRYKEQKF